ncbi:hypothetical protein [Bosea sp. AS-1]|uniref:hypothetical protein n=1 Tax=Bosea sp. AS-1 TaxID=2015316 RepID=UPI0012FD8EE4|nr:hypothetical protein [Bosea sp. AS-1]
MAIAAVLIVFSLPAFAETPFPIVDVEKRCTMAQDRAVRRADCIASEQRAYDAMKQNWHLVEDRFRSACVKQFGSVLMAYTAMERCLADSFAVQEMNRERPAKPFRY